MSVDKGFDVPVTNDGKTLCLKKHLRILFTCFKTFFQKLSKFPSYCLTFSYLS